MFLTSFVSRIPFRRWLNNLTGPRSHKRSAAPRRLAVEQLEDRLVPASFSQTGSVLTITLDNANELLTIAASGADTIDLTTTATFTGSVTAPVTFSGFGMTSGTLNTMGVLSRINIIDSAAGAAVTFSTSGADVYDTFIDVNLDNAGSGNITFPAFSVATFNKGASAVTADGNISAGGFATISATAGNLTLQSVNGSVDLYVFGGILSLSGGGNAAISAGTTVELCPTNVNGDLLVTAGGNITQGGSIVTTGTSNDRASFTSANGDVTLINMSNSIGTGVIGSVTGTHTFSVFNAAALKMGNLSMGSGALTVTAQGNINATFGSEGIRTTGPATFTIDTVTGDIDILGSELNNFGGTVTFAQTNGGMVDNASLRNINSAATLPIITGLTLNDYALQFDNAGITLPVLNVTGDLDLLAGGPIGQSGAISAATADFTLLGNYFISLPNIMNNIAVVGFHTPDTDAAASVAYTNFTGFQVGYSQLGLASLTLTSNGNISDLGYITQDVGAGPVNFVINGGGTMVTIDEAYNCFEGPVSILGSGAVTSVFLHNESTRAAFPNLPATVTNLTLEFPNAPVVFPNRTLMNLTATGKGIFQEAGSALAVSGSASFDAGVNPILLTGSNNFASIAVSNSGPNQVIINDASGGLTLMASSVGSGFLSVTSPGAITQTGAITQAPFAGRASFTSQTSIDLSNTGNDFTGDLALTCTGAGAVNIWDANDLTLGAVSILGGIDVHADDLLTQTPGTSINVSGNANLVGLFDGVLLDNLGNSLTGVNGVLSGGSFTDVTLRNSGALKLGSLASLAGTLDIVAGGAITQNAGDLVLAVEAIFDAGANAVTLTEAGNNFGTLSITSTGVNAVAVTDTDNVALKTLELGSGSVNITAGGAITTDSSGAGLSQLASANITLTATGAISLSDSDNNFFGSLTIAAGGDVNLRNQGSITVDSITTTGALIINAGGVAQLPAMTVARLISTARQTEVSANITTTASNGRIIITGATHFRDGVILDTSGAASQGEIILIGDVSVAGSLTLTTNGDLVEFRRGLWSQGSDPLTINNGSFWIGDSNGEDDAVFNMTAGTLAMSDGSELRIIENGVFQVGGTSAAETVIVDNGSGDIVFSDGTLSVGLGAVNDKLLKQVGDTGNIVFQQFTSSRLRATGLADANATPVLDAGTGLLLGTFDNSADFFGVVHDFFVGSDIVTPDYTSSTLTIKRGGTVSASGIVTGFEEDGDKYTVKASTGAAAQMVVLTNLDGELDIVIRNAAVATTLTITTTKGLGNGFTTVDGIGVNGAGAVTISAPTTDIFGGLVRVQNQLKSLVIHDVGGAVIRAGGTAAQTTAITGREFSGVDINIGSVLSALTVKEYSDTDSDIVAERFGKITVTGQPAAGLAGDFEARLVNRSSLASTALASATIAGTLGGEWDLRGAVGSVATKKVDDWRLGLAAGANVVNGNQLTKVSSLNLGRVTSGYVVAGSIEKITAVTWFSGNLLATRFGTIAITGQPGVETGDFSNVTLRATGNSGAATGFKALNSLTVQGFMNADLFFDNGNVGSIIVTGKVYYSSITLDSTANGGTLSQLRAGGITGLTLEAKKAGSIRAVGNSAFAMFGDIENSDFLIHGTPTGVALATISASHNFTDTDIVVENGSVTSILVTREMDNVNIDVLGSAGTIGTLKTGDWVDGHVTALGITSLTTTGVAQTATDNDFINGDLENVNILAFRATGGIGIGTLSVAGSLDMQNGNFIRTDNGIGTFSVRQDVDGSSSSSLISVGNSSPANEKIGRIGILKAGYWSDVDLVANSIGTLSITGYLIQGYKVEGTITDSILAINGRSLTTLPATGINLFQIANDMENVIVNAPFGINTFKANGVVDGSSINTDSLAAGTGRIGTFTAGALEGFGDIRARSIGTLQTVANFALPEATGNIYSTSVTVTGFTGPATAPVGIGAVKVAGSMDGVTFNVPNQISQISVAGGIGSSEIGAGFAANGKIGSIKAANIDSLRLTTRSLGTVTVTANTALGFSGDIDFSKFVLTGNNAGVALATLTATGRVEDSLFLVSAGNVNSFTAAGFLSSSLLLGYRIAAPGDISAGVGVWLGNFKLGSFKTTAPFSAADPDNSASFRQSFVVAQRLGVIALSGVDTSVTDSPVLQFGVGFRTAGGAAGTLTINGVLQAQGIDGDFSYVGLAG